MIQANELRISNLLLDKDGNIFEVGGVLEGSLLKKGEFIGIPVEWIKPIPLTEEWLLRFGFEQTNESEDVEWHNLHGFEIAIHEEDGQVYFVYQHMVLRHILHVHQLQNLYFALTGKELLITCK